jgi:hypothetical protein
MCKAPADGGAVGEDARTVMAEVGHSDPPLSLRVHAHSMRYREKEREELRCLIEGAEWTGKDGSEANGASAPAAPEKRPEPERLRKAKQ